jgi:hypothetical protein
MRLRFSLAIVPFALAAIGCSSSRSSGSEPSAPDSTAPDSIAPDSIAPDSLPRDSATCGAFPSGCDNFGPGCPLKAAEALARACTSIAPPTLTVCEKHYVLNVIGMGDSQYCFYDKDSGALVGKSTYIDSPGVFCCGVGSNDVAACHGFDTRSCTADAGLADADTASSDSSHSSDSSAAPDGG